jgi:hypothetical protein
VISAVFWPVAKLYKASVSGTLEKPKMEPVYPFPRILGLPFLPFRALNEILNPDKKTDPAAPPKK